MKKLLRALFVATTKRRREIEVLYFGRPSELLMMTSERLPVQEGALTLGQVLHGLRKRDARWAYELDDSHVTCTVNGNAAAVSDTVAAGDELAIFSRKSLFER